MRATGVFAVLSTSVLASDIGWRTPEAVTPEAVAPEAEQAVETTPQAAKPNSAGPRPDIQTTQPGPTRSVPARRGAPIVAVIAVVLILRRRRRRR